MGAEPGVVSGDVNMQDVVVDEFLQHGFLTRVLITLGRFKNGLLGC
jgi:hypothetical protein